MKELHALVDYENVQPTLEELAKLAPGVTDVWLFHGPHQSKQAQQLAAAHSGVTLVPRSGKGPNALDFHLTFYLGYVAARHPDAHLVVVANDKGYDPMIVHAKAREPRRHGRRLCASQLLARE
ncbi:MAG: PIN domain-containing protein [Polaromonas sp.]|nr:PIN domain-containing protein [Polaromonas sp.]